jgi:hypothetical protein
MKTCPYCGSDRIEPFKYKEGWHYCKDCDEPLEPGEVIESESENKDKTKGKEE